MYLILIIINLESGPKFSDEKDRTGIPSASLLLKFTGNYVLLGIFPSFAANLPESGIPSTRTSNCSTVTPSHYSFFVLLSSGEILVQSYVSFPIGW
jgi:hypothetical protein